MLIMKTLPVRALIAATLMAILTQCSAVSPDDPNKLELVPILTSPENGAMNQSVHTELRWDHLKGIQSYTITISTTDETDTVSTYTQVTTNSIKTVGLKPNTTYAWKVKAQSEGAPWSDTYRFETGAQDGESPDIPEIAGDFVQVHDANFTLNGEIFRFVGTNAYYLPNYQKLNQNVVTRALDLFEETGITVVRMWAFYDGYDCGYSKTDPNENVIQTAPEVYSELALRDLDQVIADGKSRGIRFILPLINFWDQLGGVCQYNTWAGAESPAGNMEFFMSNPQTQQWFKSYIHMLLNRVNTVTGIAYKDEPAIMAWQIMNEARNRGAQPEILRDWYQEIARYIKSIDTNHLVSTGEEGFDEGTPAQYSAASYTNTYTLRANEGSSYMMNTAIPEIDFGSAHWYPAEFGFGSTVDQAFLTSQRAWLDDHKAIAQSQGKPFYIGEFGLAGWGSDKVAVMYDALYEHAESIELDGVLIWQLVADGTKCWEFGGNICYPDGRADEGLYSSFRQHITNVQYAEPSTVSIN